MRVYLLYVLQQTRSVYIIHILLIPRVRLSKNSPFVLLICIFFYLDGMMVEACHHKTRVFYWFNATCPQRLPVLELIIMNTGVLQRRHRGLTQTAGDLQAETCSESHRNSQVSRQPA